MVSFITTDGCPELPSDSDTVVSGSDVKAVLCELPADTLEDIQTSDISSICTEASKDSTIPPLVAAADDRSFDASSAEDSFMPRRKENKRTASIDCNDCWEFLDDVSVAPTATEHALYVLLGRREVVSVPCIVPTNVVGAHAFHELA